MRKLLFFFFFSIAISGSIKEGVQSNYGERFSMQSHGQDFNTALFVITDKQTEQDYLFVKSGYGCALAPIQTKH